MKLENADLVVLIGDTVLAFSQTTEIGTWVQFCTPLLPTTGVAEGPSREKVVTRVMSELAKPAQRERVNGNLTRLDLRVMELSSK